MKKKITGAKVAAVVITAVVVCFVLVPSVPVFLIVPFERVALYVRRTVGPGVRGAFHGALANAENVRLRREVALLTLERDSALRLREENERLRRTMGYFARRPEKWLAAAVLSSSGGASGVSRTIRVNCGTEQGVVRGAPVAVADGLVGRVVEAHARSAVVALLTDPAVKVSCRMKSPDGGVLYGIVAGGTEELLSLSRLSGPSVAPSGTRVVTSGLGGVYPEGIEVGTLVALRWNANGLLEDASLRPAVDFSQLEDVYIRCEK